MTRLLITRPEPQASRTAENFRKAGFEVVSAPMLEVAFHPGAVRDLSVALSAGHPQAILITSQHAAEALRDVPESSGHPILAVGPASADAAREAGAKDVSVARGDANSLLVLVREKCTPRNGPLIYLRAADIAADLAGMLRADGYDIVEILTYEAKPVHRISDEAAQALMGHAIDAVLFYSARTAEIFLGVAAGQGLMPALAEVRAVAISETVAQLLREGGWRRVSTLRLSDAESTPSLLIDLFEGRTRTVPSAQPATPERPPEAGPAPGSHPVPGRRRIRWEAWLLGGTALAGLLATAQFFYQQHAARRPAERPSQHRFLTRETMPRIAAGVATPSSPEEAAPAPPPPALPETANTAQFEAMQRQLDEQTARIEALERQSHADREALAQESGKRVALGKLIRLKAAVLSGKPYADELSDVLMDDGAVDVSEDIGRIGAAASTGIATPEKLSMQLAEAMAAARTRPAKPGLWNGVKAKLAGLVVIRKIGAEQTGDDDGAILARTEAALSAGNLQAVLDETALLSSDVAPSYAAFRDAVRARLKALVAIDAAMDRLAGDPAAATDQPS